MKAASLAATMSLLAGCRAPEPKVQDEPHGTNEQLERFEYSKPCMGTEFRIVLYAGARAEADAAVAAAFARVDELDALLSDWREDSEVSELARRAAIKAPTGPNEVSADLARVIALALDVSTRSGGAFDVTIGPVVRLWRRARRQGVLPDPSSLAVARASVGFQKLRLDRAAGTLELLVPYMELDLGGIAKGDAADQALATLATFGIDRALVAAGGDVVAGAPPPDSEEGWLVALAEPDGAAPAVAIRLARGAASTSGDTYQFVEIDGRRFSHVVDPRTGKALERSVLVTVVARDGATADALATAACVLGVEQGRALIESTPGAAARFVERVDGGARACTSSGWPPMIHAPERAIP